MYKTLALLSLALLIGCASAIDYQAYDKQIQHMPKACYCLGPWLGGLCLQWGGGENCNSGKRELVVQSDKCLCLTWNSNGICIFCSPGKRDIDAQALAHVNSLSKEKACYCLGPWLGGLCLQWGGDANCQSGKRELYVQTDKCLCLTWNSNGICIFCSPGK